MDRGAAPQTGVGVHALLRTTVAAVRLIHMLKRPSVQARREKVRELTAKGMSCRAIAEELGVNFATISRDRSALRLTGTVIVGLDGNVSWQDFAEPLPPKRRREGRTDEHLLYRFFDAAGVLLYVGLTDDLPTRYSRHSVVQPWWGEWATFHVTRYPSRAVLEAAEQIAIKLEKPLHNVVHAR